jgi:hypothetical protein
MTRSNLHGGASCRRHGHERDGERIATEHHQDNEPPDCTFGVALAMLATPGRDGVREELLSALGFDASMIAVLVNQGLAT